MEFLNIISGPLIGAVIGYITNYIAIKMLFRPLKPVMIGKYRLPFTPGIVPRRKDQLAETLGNAIMDKFFNHDDLETIFTSDYFTDAVTSNILSSLYGETDAHAGAPAYTRSEDYEVIIANIKKELCTHIQEGFIRSGISAVIAEEGRRIIEKNFSGKIASILINREIIEAVAEPLGKIIEKSFAENGQDIIMPLLDAEFASISQSSAKEIISRIIPDEDMLCRVIRDVYTTFMSKHTRKIVESIDVGGMITEKVVQMNPRDIEGLVLDVVKRELNYVVLLGALVGFLIGIVNIFI